MGLSAVIGALRVVLGADTVAFDRGFGRSAGTLRVFEAQVSAAMVRVGTAIALALGPLALAKAVKGVANLADELGKMAQRVGIPVEQLSALKHAADLSGVSIGDLGTALDKFNKNLAEVASGQINDAARALEAMGISALDANGRLRDQQQILLDVADKFASYGDGANKSALAMALFGKSGAQLIPRLNQGRAGITRLTDEAERLGLVIDTKTAKSAEEFNDNLQRLGGSVQGLAIALSGPLIAALADVAGKLALAAQLGDQFYLALLPGNSAPAAQYVASLAAGFKAITDKTAAAEQMVAALQAAVAELEASGADGLAPIMLSAQELEARFKAAGEAARAMLDQILETETVPFEDKFAALDEALKEKTISEAEYAKKSKEAGEAQKKQWLSVAETASTALTSIFEENKTAAIASAIINTFVAITKALSQYAPPASYVMAGLQAAMGFAQVEKIRSTSKSTTSGSTAVTGAGGGVPSSEVSTPETPQSLPPAQTVHLSIVGKVFNRQVVLDLIEGLNDAVKDGARLIVSPA